jgi:hypothetical protein
MHAGRPLWRLLRIALAFAALPACGEGLYSRSGDPTSADTGVPEGLPPALDTAPLPRPDASPEADEGNETPAAPSVDANACSTDANSAGCSPAIDTSSMTVKAGTAGVLEFGAARVLVRSMTFDENVQLTITVVDPPGAGPVGKTFEVRQTPIDAHASIALRFQVTLNPTQAVIPDQYRLANFKPRDPVGLWVAPTGQLHDAAAGTLTADFYGLDKGPVVFALLHVCTDVSMCGQLQTCMAQLCQ